MIRILVRRLALALPVLLLVSVVSFVMLRLAPGDPALIQAGFEATEEQIEAIRERMRLNDPLPVQYWAWLTNVVRLDLGRSFQSRAEVTDLILDRLPVTLQLGAFALSLIVLFGIPMGIWSALRKDQPADQTVRVVSLLGISVPNFVLGILLVMVFGWFFPGILPYQGFVSVFDDFWEGLRTSLLPAIALAGGSIGIVARLTRASMLEVINQDYVTAARALGVPWREIVWKDALKNALMPVVTVLGLITGFILGGSVVVESVFTIPGLGRLLVESFGLRDYNVTIGVMMFIAVAFVLVNLAVDLLYGVINPRIRAGYEGGR